MVCRDTVSLPLRWQMGQVHKIKTTPGVLPADGCSIKDAANSMYGILYCITMKETVFDRAGRPHTMIEVTAYRRPWHCYLPDWG